ncbi:MAG TPA: MBL fold metallo-hydrolase [Candidatus Omnitrophota bacterium]|nr:MBL fold metallo-hydrolase [Candidatus Omnitrophota bacterium]HRY85471.1 MBL fold metallo-hydrolase [Candidatus Omnitrophota bacterium]
MKLRLIAEGSTKRERKALRWGVSFLVGNVLFDTFGRSDIFWKNIRRFKIDLSRVKHVAISHEDWDHTAGLEGFLRTQLGTKVYICAKTGKELKRLIRANGGIPVEVRKTRRIAPNIYSLGQMRAGTGRGILYEQALVVKSRNGFSVITGCAHPGIVRIVRRAVKIFGKKIYAVCGGFHMKDNTHEENKKIITELQTLGVRKVLPLHCTGAVAASLFKKIYPQNCAVLREGGTLTL